MYGAWAIVSLALLQEDLVDILFCWSLDGHGSALTSYTRFNPILFRAQKMDHRHLKILRFCYCLC